MSPSGQRICRFGTNQTDKEMLVRIVAMLSKLVERFDPDQYRVRENASGVAQSFEDEGFMLIPSDQDASGCNLTRPSGFQIARFQTFL
jgi:hypothetical protein